MPISTPGTIAVMVELTSPISQPPESAGVPQTGLSRLAMITATTVSYTHLTLPTTPYV